MDINQKLIYIETKDIFTSMNSAGELKNSSVVFIGDTGELWTHGKMFGINLSSEIDKIKESYQSAIYYYTGSSVTAAETTIKPNIIGYSSNSPVSGNFYYFDTKFYQSQSSTSNRHQMAYGYQSNNIYSRYYYNGVWSKWSRIAFEDDLSKYVTLDTEQSITGAKIFSKAYIKGLYSTNVDQCYYDNAMGYYHIGDYTELGNQFPVINNANSLLWFGNHVGNYGGQLGISSNSKLYYRFISNGVFDNILWKQLAFIDDISSTIESSNLIRYYSKGASDDTKGYYKISINSTTSWMLYFKVRLYQNYNYYDIDISGYNYGTTKMWISQKARLISASLETIEIKFGYDGPNQLWVAIPKVNWWGIGIFDVVNAFTQVSKKDLFTITVEEELTGTVQSTVTLNRLVAKNETIDYATNLAGGAIGSIPYQLTSNSTNFLTKPTINNSCLMFNTSTNKPYWSTSSIFSELSNSSDKLSMTIGDITKTLTIEYANKASYIKSSGRIAAVSGTTKLDIGLRLKTAYNNGYPESYGNVLGVADVGFSELFMGWHSSSLYYRYKSDQTTSSWSNWVKILTTSDDINADTAVTSDKTKQLLSIDDRNTIYSPSEIINGISMVFTKNSENTNLSSNYSGIVNFRPYGGSPSGSMTDFSGGPTHQLAFNGDSKIYYRTGGSSGWASWKKIALEGDYLPISGGTLTGTLNSQSIIPTSSSYNLGSASFKWDNLYVNNIGSSTYKVSYEYITTSYITNLYSMGNTRPTTNNSFDIGTSSFSYRSIYANNFIKSGSSDNYVLLGGGGHESITNVGLKTINISDGGSNASRWKVIFSTSSGNGGFGSWVIKQFLVSFSSDTLGTGMLSMFLYFTPETLLYKYMNFNGSIGMYDFNQYFKVYWDKTNKLIKIYYNTYNYGKAVIRILNVGDILPNDFADSTDYVSSLPTINGVNIPVVVNNNVGDIGEVIDEINGIYI